MTEALRIGFDPLLAWPWLAAIAAAASVLFVFYVGRGGRARLWRAASLAVLGLALANPQWIRETREPLKDVVAIVVDQSESMRFGARAEAAEATLERLQERLQADDTLDVRLAETAPGADATALYQALNTAFADTPRERIGGAFLITDGQAHDLPADPDDAAPLGPVHALIVGDEEIEDRRIEILAAPNFGIVGERADLTVKVEAEGLALAQVRVSINGEAAPPQTVRVGEPDEIRLDVPRRGPNLIIVEIDEGENELTLANNRAAAAISGVRDRLRVLLVTGEPHAGARVWRDLLKSDPSVDLVHFTILRPPHKLDATPTRELALIAFPTRKLFVERLNEFDLVIFDRYRRRGVLPMAYFDNIARYVADGGALMVAAGPTFAGPESIHRTSLASVLPGEPTGEVVDGDIQPQRSELGARHTITASLPDEADWGPWRRYIDGVEVSGETLLETPDGAPLLLLDRVGDGRVAELMSDQIWLWARGHRGGGPYGELIRRLAHWLMKEPELEEERLTLDARGGEIKARLRTLSDAPPPLRILDPEGAPIDAEWTPAEPGVFEARAAAPLLGLYAGDAGGVAAIALNGPANPREYVDLRATGDVLAPLVDATDGGVFRAGADADVSLPEIRRVGARANAAGGGWAGLKQRNAYAVRTSESRPVIWGWLGMAIAALLMMAAWRREGR